jgi:Domain of unknown function (DUF929)
VANQKTRQQRRAAERERGQRLQSNQASSRKPLLMAIGGVIGILAVIAALVGVKLAQGGSSASTSNPPAHPAGLAPAAVVQALATIPAATFDTIGYQSGVGGLKAIPGTPVKQGGKPLIAYLGADYCPYCAAQRWPLVTALQRFGTFTNLGATHSSSVDVFPNTPTFSFHGAGYTSKYIAFNGVEVATNQVQGNTYAPLDTPTALESSLAHKFDPGGTIPFTYLGSYASTGASYNPQILAGMTMQQIAQAARNPVSPQSQAILGTANMLTAAICKQTGGQPANVCSAPGVTAAAKHLPS